MGRPGGWDVRSTNLVRRASAIPGGTPRYCQIGSIYILVLFHIGTDPSIVQYPSTNRFR
jgi:hypothetical protein